MHKLGTLKERVEDEDEYSKEPLVSERNPQNRGVESDISSNRDIEMVSRQRQLSHQLEPIFRSPSANTFDFYGTETPQLSLQHRHGPDLMGHEETWEPGISHLAYSETVTEKSGANEGINAEKTDTKCEVKSESVFKDETDIVESSELPSESCEKPSFYLEIGSDEDINVQGGQGNDDPYRGASLKRADSLSSSRGGKDNTSSTRAKFRIGENQPDEFRKASLRQQVRPHLSISPSIAELEKTKSSGSRIKLKEPLHLKASDKKTHIIGNASLVNIPGNRSSELRQTKVIRHHSDTSTFADARKPIVDRRGISVNHSLHETFVQLDVLNTGGGDDGWLWEEKARWIKFEEDLEEGSERWGKPHVASLSFHSLLELRNCLEHGLILLDIEASDLSEIAIYIVQRMVITEQIQPDERATIFKALLLKHKHVDEKRGLKRTLTQGTFMEGRKLPSVPELKSINSVKSLVRRVSTRRERRLSNSTQDKRVRRESDNDTKLSIPEHDEMEREQLNSVSSLQHEASNKSSKMKSSILNRIPLGAECTSVLVGSLDKLKQPVMVFVRLSQGRMIHDMTEVPLPTRFMVIIMGPNHVGIDYYEVGRSISTLMANSNFREEAYIAREKSDLLDNINEFLTDSIVLPPGRWDKKTLLPIMEMAREKAKSKIVMKEMKEKSELSHEEPPPDPLRRTGSFFGGLVNDVMTRYPKYISDLRDAINLQCLTTFFFIYFACLAPAVTFGGLLREKTEKHIGVSETLVGTSFVGMMFALLSGQPLMLVGVTGPVNVFDAGLYQICGWLHLEYLPMRAWVGLWVTVFAVFTVMFDGSFLVKYFTRFVEEIFATLIALIFIYEAFARIKMDFKQGKPKDYGMNVSTVEYFLESVVDDMNFTESITPNFTIVAGHLKDIVLKPLKQTYGWPNTALMSIILIFGTFLIALFLKKLRNSKFLGRPIRRAIGDFGVPISIILMVLLDAFLIEGDHSEKLDMPDGISVTDPSKREWFINPLGINETIPVWAPFLASVLALLVFILIFIETQITGLIVNKKERNLVKGSGYFLDLLLMGISASFSGLFGFPFFCSATVRTVSHVSALSIYSRTHAPGEKPKLLGVREQRLTGFAVHLMIGLSILLGPVLRQIPVAVLFGVFLYMGIASLSGIQFLDRAKMLLKPAKHHPNVKYVRKVRTIKMHLFTSIQMIGLLVLWTIKSTKAALGFPFFLILLVPVRFFLLRYLFTPHELEYLDNEEDELDDSDDEPDFFNQARMPG